MAWTNYHSHTDYCDGSGRPADFLAHAVEEGVLAYGFSTHAPLPRDVPWAVPAEKLPDYLREINGLKGTSPVEVYTGLEVDFYPGFCGPGSDLIVNAGLDYTIGSVHIMGFFENGRPWEIDGPYVDFVAGLNQIFEGNLKALVTQYFAHTREMAEKDCPDIIGHFDKIKIQNRGTTTWDEEAAWYREAVGNSLESIRDSGGRLEVNTRGIYKKLCAEPYPSTSILREAMRMGIPVVLNSDCHHPSEICREFGRVAELLSSVGFRHLHALIQGDWQAFQFDNHGLILPEGKF